MKTDRIANSFKFHKFLWGSFWFIVVANVVLYITIIGNQQGKIDNLQNSYTVKRRAILQDNGGENQKFTQAEEDIATFKKRLPGRTTFSDVVMEWFKALQRQGLYVDKMTYKPEIIDSQSLIGYTTSFTVNGSYGALKALLADIQNSKELICIESLSFSNQSDEKESVNMTLKIATYFK